MINERICMIMDGNFIDYQGVVYSPHMNYDAFLSRFSESFESIEVVSRAFPKTNLSPGLKPVCQGNSHFTSLCSKRGAIGFLMSLFKNARIIKKSIDQNSIVLIRYPGNIAILATIICLFKRKEFSIELVAEPKDYFSVHSSKSPLRLVFKAIHTFFTKLAVRHSKVVRYVTKNYLQNSYPSDGVTYGFSDVYLPSGENFSTLRPCKYDYDIVNVAMMHNYSKGHLLLIDAISELLKYDIKVKACFIGDGKLKKEFELYAKSKGVDGLIDFVGAIVDRTDFYRLLHLSRFFVLSSYQEGMPRAMLEAMNSGLVSISSDVGGVPEVLSKQAMFQSGNLAELVQLIKHCITDVDYLENLRELQSAEITKFEDAYIRKLTFTYCQTLKKVYCDITQANC